MPPEPAPLLEKAMTTYSRMASNTALQCIVLQRLTLHKDKVPPLSGDAETPSNAAPSSWTIRLREVPAVVLLLVTRAGQHFSDKLFIEK